MAGPEVTFEPATDEHVAALAPLLRAEDQAEVLAEGYGGAAHALLESIAASDLARAVLFDGEVAAIFGVAPTKEPGTGFVWMLTGRAVARHPKAFLRACRPTLAALLEGYSRLVNVVDARYAAALRWARWLGFSVGQAAPLVPGGHFFCPIDVRRQPWVQ